MLLIAQLPNRCLSFVWRMIRGDRIAIEGQQLNASWPGRAASSSQPERLWLPLNLWKPVCFRRSRAGGNDQLEWFGQRQDLQSFPTRTHGDEVGLEVASWLNSLGVTLRRQGNNLSLELPTARLQQLRQGKGSTAGRLVLDIDQPVFVQRRGNDLLLNLRTDQRQQSTLRNLGLMPKQVGSVLMLRGQATNLQSLTLAGPARWTAGRRLLLHDPRGARVGSIRPGNHGLIRRGLIVERRTIRVGVKPLEILRAGGDLPRLGLTLTPLAMAGSQQGLVSCPSSQGLQGHSWPPTVGSTASNSFRSAPCVGMGSGCRVRS